MKRISLLVLVVVVGWWLIKGSNNNDFRVGMVSDKGITMQSISWERRMINYLEVGGETPVWIPGGMGWYQSNKIKKILEQEKKPILVEEVFFYNFGFVPDLIVYGDEVKSQELMAKWGMGNYLKYQLNKANLMVKREVAGDNLGEVVQRDLADSRLLRDDLRLTVYNLSQANGLGKFMARVLEWGGLTVVGVETSQQKIEGDCQISFGAGTVGYASELLKSKFPKCQFQNNESLGGGEAELYFGEGFFKMLNYDTYVRTF